MKPKYYSKAEKYPGAYVFPPDKGMTPDITRLKNIKSGSQEDIDAFHKDRPVSCLDFASLYPSLIMTYNLSPEKIILDKSDKEYWENQGQKIHDINFNVGSKNIQAWSILHENKTESMGLFPKILQELFRKRKEMKGLLKTISEKKELYELIFSKGSDYIKSIQIIESELTEDIIELDKEITFIPPGSTTEEERDQRNKRKKDILNQLNILKTINKDTIDQDYANICFDRNCINTKQNALKVYMNTFYGETGNHLSPFFLLQLAGGVTSAGQTNI
jgi:DNA polymerase elongation subunit (family B)